MGKDEPNAKDRQLIDRYLRADPEAMEIIDDWIDRSVRSFRPRLAHVWDDILQEIRLETIRSLREGRFRGRSTLKTYLWRTAGYICIQRLRRHNQWGPGPPEMLDLHPSSEDSPLEGLLKAEAHRLRLEVLESMPEDCRRIWRLIIQGHTYQQISLQMGLKESTLRVRALRCRRQAAQAAWQRVAAGSPATMGDSR